MLKRIVNSKIFSDAMRLIGYEKSASFARTLQNAFNGQQDVNNVAEFQEAYQREAWVYACVYLISNTIAGTNYKITDTQGKKINSGQIIELFDNPNYEDSSSSFYNLIEMTAASMELAGNSYWLLDKKVNGFPTVLMYLNSARMTVLPNKDSLSSGFVGGYIYDKGLPTEKYYNVDDIAQFKNGSMTSNLYGQASISAGINAINLHREAQKTNYKIFKNGAHLDGVFETEQELSDVAFSRLQNNINSKYASSDNAHKNMILEAGLKYKPSMGGMKDLEYIEGTKLSREEICAVFGVPPHMVGILDKSSYANTQQAEVVYWKYTILPKFKKIEAVVNNTIVKKFDSKLKFEFDLSNINALQDDNDLISQIATRYFNIGIPLNDIIAKLNLPFEKVDGGDKGFVPFSLSPIGETDSVPISEDTKIKSDNKDLTEGYKKSIWKSFDRHAKTIERRYKMVIDLFFSALEKEVLSNGAKSMKGADDFNFDPSEIINEWAKKSGQIHKLTVKTRGQSELTAMNVNVSFSVDNPRIRAWIEKYSLEKAKEVIGALRRELQQSLAEGQAAGESIPDLSKRVQEIFAPYKDAKYKADRIARTEVIGASNRGALEAFTQSGVVVRKRWLASRDDRTRDDHREADGQEVGIDDAFDVGGESLDFPGDPKGSAENVIQCRCTIIPVMQND